MVVRVDEPRQAHMPPARSMTSVSLSVNSAAPASGPTYVIIFPRTTTHWAHGWPGFIV